MEELFDTTTETIRVLYLDADPAEQDHFVRSLEREPAAFDVRTAHSAKVAVDQLPYADVDCIVSTYELPDKTGLEFLKTVRVEQPNLPFILVTAKGSEEIASEAISSGVTDYVQRQGDCQYTVLANRIRNAVSQYRTERELEERSDWYQRILAGSSDYVIVVDKLGTVKYASPAIERVTGYTPDDVTGDNALELIHPADAKRATTAFADTVKHPNEGITTEFRTKVSDGSYRWLEARGTNFLDDSVITGLVLNVRDVTNRKQREQALRRQNDHLKDLTTFLSHDVQNQLAIVKGSIEFAREKQEFGELDRALFTTSRIKEMIRKVQELAHSAQQLSDKEPVDLNTVTRECWKTVTESTVEAELTLGSSIRFTADEERLRGALENMLMNSVTHGGTDITVRVGRLPETAGFYVEDDGRGIPEVRRDEIFDSEYTTAKYGTGLGLTIVSRIVDAHGWTILATESDEGGARFEVTGVETVS
jgi:PAS domain S-box-containing protein